MPGGNADIDALDREQPVDDPTAAAVDAPDGNGHVVAGDIDPLMGDASFPGGMTPGQLTLARRGRRRWWQRIIEFEPSVGPTAEPGGNGHHVVTDERADIDTDTDGTVDLVGAEARADEDAVGAGTVADERTDADDIEARAPVEVDVEPDELDLEASDDRAWEGDGVVVLAPLPPPVALAPPTIEDRPAWHAVPVVDLPEGDEADLADAPPLERARTGEIPRVPVLAAERAQLVPEPRREPTWLQRRRIHRPRVRRVTRVVRRIDSWTVFKVALLFWIVAYVILVIAGVLLWSVAVSTGTIDNVESFVKDLLALDTFIFDGQKIFRASWVLGAFMAVAGTGLTVTMAVLYNLFSDLVGGVRVTVLEEEVVQRPPSRPVD